MSTVQRPSIRCPLNGWLWMTPDVAVKPDISTRDYIHTLWSIDPVRSSCDVNKDSLLQDIIVNQDNKQINKTHINEN